MIVYGNTCMNMYIICTLITTYTIYITIYTIYTIYTYYYIHHIHHTSYTILHYTTLYYPFFFPSLFIISTSRDVPSRPDVEFLLEQLAGALGLQAERVAAEVHARLGFATG